MAFRIMTIPFDPLRKLFFEEDLNLFCMDKRIRSYKAEFFQSEQGAFWTVFLEYSLLEEEKEGKVPKHVGLNAHQQALYEELRIWRAETAKQRGLPAYMICTNTELMALVIQRCTTLESLKRIRGFGRKKIETLGSEIMGIIQRFGEQRHE